VAEGGDQRVMLGESDGSGSTVAATAPSATAIRASACSSSVTDGR
jgi:hypothetical protein